MVMGIKTRMILAFFGIVLLASVLSLTLSYTTTRRYFIEETRGHLAKLASTVAANLNGDVLRSLTIEDLAKPEYQTEKDKLRRFARAVPEARVAYFYRAIPDKPGVMDLVVDALEPGQKDAVTPDPNDRYYDTIQNDTPEMRAGLAKATADPELTTDESGVWLSGYAPVFASDGTPVGAFGLDLPAKNVLEGQRELLTLLGLSVAGALAVALLVGLVLARAIARPIQNLAEATHVIAGGDLSTRVLIDRKDEIGDLGRDFNKMVGNLQAMADALQRYTTEALESHEEQMALQLQKVLLPPGDLRRPGVAVTASLRPVPWGGGDTYQHFLFGSGAYLMLAYGHVRASGLVACSLVTLVQSRLSLLVSNLVLRPGEILAELSRAMRSSAPGLAAMDYLCAVYDLEKRWLAYGTAGTTLVFLVRPATGELQRLGDASQPPLGMDGAGAYGDVGLEMEAGDRLVVCSAHAAEVKGPSGERFGLERVEEALRRLAGRPIEELREELMSEVTRFAGADERIEDDLTVLVAELGAEVHS
jgi:serine phosphatase RsbU (regulator of sigma subunit)